ncbi:MAG TPA: ParA family protein [Candidatus Gordonibacter avicola]|nr:ParA family protein [Candidatus Gordonibacter avicola]
MSGAEIARFFSSGPFDRLKPLPSSRPPITLTAVVVICGHYGVGKTNLTLNLAFDIATRGFAVTVVDLDVVNPFFRSSDYRARLAEHGVRLIAPVFAGTNLDGPSLSGTILPAVEQAQRSWLPLSASVCSPDEPAPIAERQKREVLIIDAGGDDVGATALGRFANTVAAGPYEMLYVVNRSRNLTQEPAEAAAILHEIEAKCHLRATGIVNNTHLQDDTDGDAIAQGIPFAEAVAQACELPLVCTTVPASGLAQVTDREIARVAPNEGACALYPVQVYVRTPWQ